MTYLEWRGHYISDLEKSAENKVTYFLHVSYTVCFYLLVFKYQWNFVSKRADLCTLQNDFSNLSIEKSKNHTQAVKKAWIYGIILAICWLASIVLVMVGYWMTMLENVSSELKLIVAIYFIFISICTLFFMCIFYQGFILCLQLNCNMVKASEEVFLDRTRTDFMLENTVQFIKRTKRTSKLLSSIYFHQISIGILAILFQIYLIIDFTMGSLPHNFFIYVGMVVSILGIGFKLILLNIQSEDLKEIFKDIKQEIQCLTTCKDSIVEINGKKHDEAYARKLVIAMLDEFRGFDANGYFILGKPFIVTFFATVVILLSKNYDLI